MSYRKEKKVLTKLLKIALDIQDNHPLSGSANGQVQYIKRILLALKRTKNGNP